MITPKISPSKWKLISSHAFNIIAITINYYFLGPDAAVTAMIVFILVNQEKIIWKLTNLENEG